MNDDTRASLGNNGSVSAPDNATSSGLAVPVPDSVASNSTGRGLSGSRRRMVASETRHPAAKKAKRTGSVHSNVCYAIAQQNAVNDDAPLRSRVALLAGYPKVNPGFNKALSTLKSHGLIEYPTSHSVKFSEYGILTLFQNGYEDLGIGPLADNIKSPKNNAEMQKQLLALIKNMKGGSPNKMVQVFSYLRNGEERSRADVARGVGYTGETPGFKKVLTSMSGIGLVNLPTPRTVQLDDFAFPFGRNAS